MGITDTVGDLKDRAVQMTVAGMKKAWDGAKAGKAKVDEFAAALRPDATAEPGTKKSEDYSGACRGSAQGARCSWPAAAPP